MAHGTERARQHFPGRTPMTLTLFQKAGAMMLAPALVMGAAVQQAWALTPEEIANYTGADRQKVLEEGAKKEKALLWMGGINEPTGARPLLQAYMAKYPYIDAKYIRTGTADGTRRLMTEVRAKNVQTDLYNGASYLDL